MALLGLVKVSRVLHRHVSAEEAPLLDRLPRDSRMLRRVEEDRGPVLRSRGRRILRRVRREKDVDHLPNGRSFGIKGDADRLGDWADGRSG